MYKTIRHGENSLQYTILPQNDDFRIEGKLTSASSNSSNGKAKFKRSARRRSFFAYLGLLFVCAVIIGAILVPFLISAECLPNPSDWFLKTRAAFTGTTNQINATSVVTTTFSPVTSTTTDERNRNKAIDITIKPYPINSKSTVVPQTKGIGEAGDVPIFILTKTANDSETRPTEISEPQIKNNNFVAEVRFEGLRGQMEEDVVPTIVVTTSRKTDQNIPAVIGGRILPETTTSIVLTIRPTSASIVSNITGRVIQVPLLKSTSKKTIIPPVLAKTNSFGRESVNIFLKDEEKQLKKKVEENQNKPSYWIRSHWPYIDPSTYFQWTGYKAEDSVILPAILGAALIVIIMIIALFFIARNKRTYVNSVRKRNRNDIEAAGEDNTTLLINTNLSDDD